MFRYSYNKIFWGPRKFCGNDHAGAGKVSAIGLRKVQNNI